jgi:hypothetical protein
MALKPNAVLVFTRYDVTDTGVRFHFVCHDPGPGEVSDYPVFLTDAEMAAVTSLATFNAALLAKLKRYWRAEGIASKLDGLIGRSITLP